MDLETPVSLLEPLSLVESLYTDTQGGCIPPVNLFWPLVIMLGVTPHVSGLHSEQVSNHRHTLATGPKSSTALLVCRGHSSSVLYSRVLV